MESRNIKLAIAYDGTDFCGWQRQGQDRTVQGVLEEALEKIHKHPVNLTGAGRTDSGVHAAGQCANFYTDIKNMEAARFVPALNSIISHDIRILEASEAPDEFHARFSACTRTYRYHFIRGTILPYESRYALHINNFPDIKILNAYGRLLSGETDCSIFTGAGDTSKSKNRYIYKAVFFIERNRLVFEITANAFLRKMIRSAAGTFLHYQEKGVTPEELNKIIESKDRGLAGPTLPPNGLFLWNVGY